MRTIPSSGARHHLVRWGIFLIVAAFIAVMTGCGARPVEIHDWYDLDDIRYNMRGSYILMDNLDSTTAGYEELASPTANEGKGWQPIGRMAVNEFTGSFDGLGYEIRDLFIDRADESDVGLFGVIGEGGIIDSVGAVVYGDVAGYGAVGSLVGYNRGSVRNSYACSSVTGNLNVGSLVGRNSGTVSSSYSGGNVTGGNAVGGLVGKNEGTISNSYSTGAVNGNDFVGDLVGLNSGTVSNSYTSGTVNGSNFVGGLVGRNEGTVSMCYSTGSVIGDEYAGGLVGQNSYGVVSNSFWDTETSGQGSSDGGVGKTTTEMQDINTFTGAGWDIVAVANSNARNTGYVWNIVDDATYPFLGWQPP